LTELLVNLLTPHAGALSKGEALPVWEFENKLWSMAGWPVRSVASDHPSENQDYKGKQFFLNI
jgi:hypothetical protein